MIVRECTKCGATKPIEEYYLAKLGLHGRMAWCKLCDSERRRAYNTKYKDKVRKQQQAWAEKSRKRVADTARRYRDRHPDRVAAYGAEYRQVNADKRVYWQLRRQARKKQATPAWAELDKIRAIYEACPEGYHVDHIIPLMAMDGREHIACGLHCEDNLRYLAGNENVRKSAQLVA